MHILGCIAAREHIISHGPPSVRPCISDIQQPPFFRVMETTRQEIAPVSSGAVPAQSLHFIHPPSQEGRHTMLAHFQRQGPPLRHHAVTKRLSSSSWGPAITYINSAPLPTGKEASRLCFQSSVLSPISHCPAAVPGHFLWLGGRQTVFSSTDRHRFASWASLGCYSMTGTISPVPDTSELHLGSI